MITVTTEAGHVRPGQLYRDTRASNVRTLRVDRIEVDDRGGCDVHYTVIRQEYEGEITEPMRKNRMTADRLTSRSFVLVEGGAANA